MPPTIGERALSGCFWGLLSAVSLVLGALIGIHKKPSQFTNACMMAFGGGALIEALTIELFGNIINEQAHYGPAVTLVALGAAISGGVFFTGLNRLLNSHGGFLRKKAYLKDGIKKLRVLAHRRLIARLELVPFLHHLSPSDLDELSHTMKRVSLRAGQTLYTRSDATHAPLYFLLTGAIKVAVHDFDQRRRATSTTENFVLTRDATFGDIGLLTGISAASEAVALRPTKVLRIQGPALHRWLSTHPDAQQHLAEMAARHLRETGLFAAVPPSAIGKLQHAMHSSTHAAGTVLLERIDESSPVFVIVAGEVTVACGEHFDETEGFRCNDILGLHHLVLGRAVAARATTREATTVLRIEREALESAMGMSNVSAPDGSSAAPPQLSSHPQLHAFLRDQRARAANVTPAQERRLVLSRGALETSLRLQQLVEEFDALNSAPDAAPVVKRPPSPGLPIVLPSPRACPAIAAKAASASKAAAAPPVPRTAESARGASSELARATDSEASPSGSSSFAKGPPAGSSRTGAAASFGKTRTSRQTNQRQTNQRQTAAASTEPPSLHTSLAGYPTLRDYGWAECTLEHEAALSSSEEHHSLRGAAHRLAHALHESSSGHLLARASPLGAEESHTESTRAHRALHEPSHGRQHYDKHHDKHLSAVHRRSIERVLDEAEGISSKPLAEEMSLSHQPNGHQLNGHHPSGQWPSGHQPSGPTPNQSHGEAELHSSADGLEDAAHSPELDGALLEEQLSMVGGVEGPSTSGGGKSAALAIWLGILFDGIPESFVLGILTNRGDLASLVTFTVGVFLANFPEAMSSAAIMRTCGMRPRTVLLRWSAIWLGTGLGAACGAMIFGQSEGEDFTMALLVSAIEGLCGGAMLTLIANTVLPEAFEQGGDAVGLSCLLGFMAAIAVKSIGMEFAGAPEHEGPCDANLSVH